MNRQQLLLIPAAFLFLGCDSQPSRVPDAMNRPTIAPTDKLAPKGEGTKDEKSPADHPWKLDDCFETYQEAKKRYEELASGNYVKYEYDEGDRKPHCVYYWPKSNAN